MSTPRITVIGCVAAFLFCCAIGTAWADRDQHRSDRRTADRHVGKGHVSDNRYGHDRYYPRRGHFVSRLPAGSHRTVYYGAPNYYYQGIWYRPSGFGFTVIAPPVGVVIPVLPPYFTTIWSGGVPYYYAGGTYYRWYPERRGYMVSERPDGTDAFDESAQADQLFVYPSSGQNEELQALDRFECHSWAVNQSGFDPTRPGGNVPLNENGMRRANYDRATEACLEARGYSVR